ncbi:hypothetical protein [Massilia sp. METH4]|uniref:hypothetical protein n=1 Tax=Massilia sp. METH4 TaxID=3123041 RepID=UPI0030CFFE42
MSENGMLWVLIIVFVSLVAVYALWRGGKFGITYGDVEVNVEGKDGKHKKIRIFNDSKVSSGAEVADISGVKNATDLANGSVEVGNGTVIEGKVANITGVDIGRKPT